MKILSRLWLKRIVVGLLFLGVLLLLAVICRVPLLRESARLWIVNQPVTKADAIVVLGGGVETRPFAAAQLFQQGLAPKILIMNVKPSPATELGIAPTEAALTRQELVSAGVAETNIQAIGQRVANSYDESLAVRDWVLQTGAQHIIITTDIFHTRRVRWLYAKECTGLKVNFMVVAVAPRQYNATNWWQREDGIIAFQNEIIKTAYYRLKY